MGDNLAKSLEKLIEKANKPTSEDRIAVLESAITDIAIMLMEVSNNG